MTLRTFLSALLLLVGARSLSAQVVWTDPLLPTRSSTVTVYFDASQGNGELAGFSGTIYAHTGVITNESSGLSDWKFVQGTWGSADPDVEMTALGGDLYSITYPIETFYGVPSDDTILQMAFVFRNADGTTVGRAADGSDIYTPVFRNELSVAFIEPAADLTVLEPGENLDVRIAGLLADSIFLFDDASALIATDAADASTTIPAPSPGEHVLTAVARDASSEVTATATYFVRPPVAVAPVPAGVDHGINVINDSTVTLVLFAPDKDFVFVLGDWNDWRVGTGGYLNRDPDGETWWVTVTGLDPDRWYAYQYFIDGELQLADYMAELVLDPSNDPFISEETFPDLPAYPEQGNGYVSVLRTVQEPYAWNTSAAWGRPAIEDLVIYELHIRDFLATRNYQTLLDTLGYLKRLGINAIEFMPLGEFEGNESWGYNPSFHAALDKYYGTKNALKTLIDSCHANGIAVILDMVLNHAFGQSPMVRMYWDGSAPAANSPWFNQAPTHDFNVGFDYNHESPATRKYSKDVMRYWLEEYRFDGYRMDLSKGFTQNQTLGNVGAWSAYDASRIAIWKDYADEIFAVDPDAYLILEHFADNNEERELADYGMMTWGNINHDYRNLVKGYSSNLNWGVYAERGYSEPMVVSFMESHDEERLMHDALTFGNQAEAPDYDVRDFQTARFRCEMGAALFFPYPGPKMLWQFGELGYDYSIDYNGRTGNKPVRWDYYENPSRRRLFQIYAELIRLKTTYDVFRTDDFTYSLSGTTKRIRLNHPDMNVLVIGNTAVDERTAIPAFQHTGWWYDHFSGDSIEVLDPNSAITLAPGEYHLYTDVRLATPELLSTVDGTAGPIGALEAWPNPAPAGGTLAAGFELGAPAEVQARFVDLQGRTVSVQALGQRGTGYNGVTLAAPREPGLYLLELAAGAERRVIRLLVR